MTEQPTTEQPYTEADVTALAGVLHDEGCGWNCQGHGIVQEANDRRYRRMAEAALRSLAGRLLPEGASARGMCGAHAPTLFGAGLDLQVCELLAGHTGWHGRPNGPGQPWMNWTNRMVVESEVRPVPINEESTEVCCDLHGRNCEQGGEECCERCTEAHHFAPGHGGVPCSNPDLSATSGAHHG